MVNKLTDTVKPLDEINKINEIIDELDNVDALPSQTGNAGKFLTTDGTDASWGIPTSRNIGEIVQSSLPLIDAGLHLLDGALLSGDGIYGDFVDYIANNYTVLSTAFTSESAWQSSVTNYGSCGKFVYDSTNNTVRLPKVSDILQGTTDANALGDLVEAGLPNITGTAQTAPGRGGYTTTGAMYQYNTPNATNVYGNGATSTNTQYGIGFDASRSSSIYGNSSTVQPQTIRVLYYIVVTTSTKTDIQVDIDQIATDLNQKQDINTCVLKTGDTMSGALRVNNTLQATGGFDLISDAVTKGTNPSSTAYWGIRFNDGSNRATWQETRLGLMECSLDTSGTTQLQIGALKNEDNSTSTSAIALSHKTDGTKNIWFNVNSVSGAVAEIKCVTQTYVNGTSWYRVWSDGWIEQGGFINGSSNAKATVTFLKSFSNTNYTINALARWSAEAPDRDCSYYNKQTNSVQLYRDDYENGIDWYACGY